MTEQPGSLTGSTGPDGRVALPAASGLAQAGARGSLVTVLAQAANVGLRVVNLVVLARLLAPDDFGLVAIAASITTIVMAAVFFGLPTAATQATDLSERAHSALLVINTALGFLLGSALFLSAPAISALYDDPLLLPVVQWLALVPLISGINAQFRVRLIMQLRFGALSAAELIAQALGIVAAIVLASLGLGWRAIVAQLVVTPVAQLVLTAIAARWRPVRPGGWRAEVAPITRVGGHVFGTTVLQSVSKGALVPALGLVTTPTALGQFDRAQQLVVMPISLTVDQLQRVVVPILSRLRAEPRRMLSYMQRFQLINAYGTATIFALAAALGPALTRLVLGPGWELAGTILQILAVGAVFRAAVQSMQWLFISCQQTSAGLRLAAWSLPAVTLLSLAGMPWGVVGVAVANTIAWSLYWPVSAVWTARATGFQPRDLMAGVVRGTLFFALPLGVAASAANLLPLDDGMTVLVGVCFALLSAALLVLAVAPVRRDVLLVWRTTQLALRRQRVSATTDAPAVDTTSTGDSQPGPTVM